MGMVLAFVPPSAARKKPSRTHGTTATVVIFPGVRYERLEAGAALVQVKKARAPAGMAPAPRCS